MSEIHDDQVAAARRGEPAAFRWLVDSHSRAVFQLCWRITRDSALAEDAAQEAFYNAWRALPGFDGRASFATWLHRIAANAALEQLRRNSRHRAASSDPGSGDPDAPVQDFLDTQPAHGPGPEQQAHGEQLTQRIAVQMDAMSALERAAFVLRHVEGESLESIARTLSLNIGQSKQAVFRAVRKLRGALQEWSEA